MQRVQDVKNPNEYLNCELLLLDAITSEYFTFNSFAEDYADQQRYLEIIGEMRMRLEEDLELLVGMINAPLKPTITLDDLKFDHVNLIKELIQTYRFNKREYSGSSQYKKKLLKIATEWKLI